MGRQGGLSDSCFCTSLKFKYITLLCVLFFEATGSLGVAGMMRRLWIGLLIRPTRGRWYVMSYIAQKHSTGCIIKHAGSLRENADFIS